MACLSAGTLLTPRLVGHVDTYAATGWQAAIGGLPPSDLALVTRQPVHFTSGLVLGVAFLALGASIAGMSLWLLLIQRVGPAGASIAQFMPPVFGVAIGAAFLGEPLTLLESAAVLPIALGLLLATRSTARTPSHGAAPGKASAAPMRCRCGQRGCGRRDLTVRRAG
ncbi:DMT family transporter [Streptomyces sp. NPDC020362]|uniref:DMT family transporter n=1 Tax=unclassified Streptomyces TaxID=2593676 RepID=UPI0033D88240